MSTRHVLYYPETIPNGGDIDSQGSKDLIHVAWLQSKRLWTWAFRPTIDRNRLARHIAILNVKHYRLCDLVDASETVDRQK